MNDFLRTKDQCLEIDGNPAIAYKRSRRIYDQNVGLSHRSTSIKMVYFGFIKLNRRNLDINARYPTPCAKVSNMCVYSRPQSAYIRQSLTHLAICRSSEKKLPGQITNRQLNRTN
ncbi:hypothetical protein T265_02391 [Opisthorchis viverrini]|uniref:Uncharacterized protein n=1 Tax=Opisthorchis viverrini TaxID=6198 RepID=A0A074ZZA5_OPIVI|nr:hypothetical protein T265_02391 [Opisthorchis viverrini]KER31337.1 hypothetical protein T265_02391 [Opisthorchis viverrini]